MSSSTKQPAITAPKLGIRALMMGVTLALVTGSVLVVGWLQERHTREALVSEVEARLLLEARNLALTSASAFMSEFPELTLHPITKELQSSQPELHLVTVVDRSGITQGHADSREIGQKASLPPELEPQSSSQPLKAGEVLMSSPTLFMAKAPVLHIQGETMGHAYIAIPRSYLDDKVSASRKQLFLALSAVLALAVLMTLIFVTRLLRPVAVLRKGLERIGQGDLETKLVLKDKTEFGMLASTINTMSSELQAAQDEMVEKERMAHELNLAREIQSSLLPDSNLETKGFVIQGAHEAAQEVGGDYYDMFELADGRIGFMVADVAGKGLVGCLIMSMLSALVGSFRDTYDSPMELLVKLDERLGENMKPGSFVTMFYGILDPDSGELVFSSAGHSPLIVYRGTSHTIEHYETQGIPLGAVRGGVIRSTLKDEAVTLMPGDCLLQYTDGINESFDPSGEEQFGFDRMGEVLAAQAGATPKQILENMQERLRDWQRGGSRLDDETLLVVQRRRAAVDSSSNSREQVQTAKWLHEAQEIGQSIVLKGNPTELDRIRPWLESIEFLANLEGAGLQLLSSAVYEACANIVEHGYQNDATKSFQLWWVQGSENPYFLILDQGLAYSADNWKESNFEDRDVRLRGRGIGLDIIHRVMTDVQFGAGENHENLTRLVFNPDIDWNLKHAS
ncbi:MAG: SpoIIE family protein phosphatase [Candidatus Eisenbacteria bacterium]|uniref:SpoIIE family protein phosphatase n=1 Tax=Eiseniibacteriota bacterium TaxID=2212470 RepID=A0A7Y2E998_UNCEI|nr:SpoIIE family protein phosphatase [Candidatus Eisenbacteria bacterium]